MCVFEGTGAQSRDDGEEKLLAVPDSGAQIDHDLNVATNNYPRHLDRRFDRVICIDLPDGNARRG